MDESAVTNTESNDLQDGVRIEDIDGFRDSDGDDVQESLLDRVTVTHLAYAAIIALAVILRFGHLGLIHLSPDEAFESIAVWRFWNQPGTELLIGSPLYFSLNIFFSQLLGFSDASMRLAPALFGLALVFMPWFIRDQLGKTGTLFTGAILAISPTLVLISRTAGGQSAALFAGMLVFVAWIRFNESKQEKWLYGISAGLGIGFISAPLFFNIIICMALAWLIHRSFGRSINENNNGSTNDTGESDTRAGGFTEGNALAGETIVGLTAAGETEASDTRAGEPGAGLTSPIRPQTVIWSSALFIAIVVLGSTALFLNLSGFGSSVSLITEWLTLFTFTGDALALITPILALGRYEIIILFFGGIAVIWAALKGKPFPLLLTYWLILTLLLTFLQRGYIFNVLLLAIPGYLLVGTFLGEMIRKPINGYQLLLIGLIVVLGSIVLVNIARYARLLTVPASTASQYNILLSITLLAIISVAIILTWNWDERAAIQSLTISALIILIIISWGSAWWLSRSGANDSRERWVTQATDDDMPILVNAIDDVSWQLKNSGNDLSVTSTIYSPALEWYLRDLDQLQFVSSIPQDVKSDALLTGLDLEPALEDSYVGSTFSYLRADTTHVLDPGQALRWWLFRQSPISINQENLIFWVRADLLENSN